MSQSDKLAIRKMLAELYAQPQQQVPPGNPIADYYAGRADSKKGAAEALGTMTGLGLPLSALGWLTADPIEAAAMTAMTAGAGYGAKEMSDGAHEDRKASNMWFNRFGNNNGRQGMPGTPSGPAYRRAK